MKRPFEGRSGAVAGLLATLVVATLLFLGVSYLAVGASSDLRSATTKAELLKAKTRELQDATRIGNVFTKGWFAQPATREPVMDYAQTLASGVRSQSVPLADPLAALTRCQVALEQLRSEQATIAAPAFTDASLAASQKAMVALYDPPIAEVRQTVELIARWPGLTPEERGDAIGSLQEAGRKSLAQSDVVAARQRQIAAASARSRADDAELSRQIDEGFAQVRTRDVRSVVMVALGVVLAAVSVAFAFWPRSREQESSTESGSKSEG